MKSLKQIKKELHEYIDGSSDEKELMALYENTLKYLKSDSNKDKVKSDKESKESIARWFNEGGKNP